MRTSDSAADRSVYPGKTDDDVILESGPLFINDTIDQFYLGIEPAGGPLPALPILPMHEIALNRYRSQSLVHP